MVTILEEYISKHPKSSERYDLGLAMFPSGVTHDNRYVEPFPLYMDRGIGPIKWDIDGNEYIDYVSGHGSLILGHSHPAISDAVKKQIMAGTHLGACTEQEIRWGNAIKALVPSIEKLRFHSSGTEATLMAMRLARAYTGKSKIIKFQDHFHGWHDYAMAGSDNAVAGIALEILNTMVVIPSGDLAAVESILQNDHDIAAVILEPTGAHYGQLPFDISSYLTGLRELTTHYGVVLIFDEVVTGFRASPGGAQERYEIVPDLTTMAKIVAGALPGGVVGGRADIIDMMAFTGNSDWDNNNRVYHPGTFNANPLSAVAGATCLELIASEPINRLADSMALQLKNGLNDIFSRLEVSGHAHGIASMIHVVMDDCDCDREICSMSHERIKNVTKSPLVTSLKRGLINNGVDIMGRDTFLVSATHSNTEIQNTLDVFERTLGSLREEGLL
jgi:glutamate-1-semialdehyde 2,1-aminomutase